MTESEPIFLLPVDWETMTDQEQLAWSAAFLRAVLAAWNGEEPDPE